MIRKYGFEISHFLLWMLAAMLLFFQQWVALPFALSAIVLSVVSFAINFFYRQVKSSLLILAPPLLTVAVVLPLQSTNALNWVEFALAKKLFQAKVDALPAPRGEPRLLAFVMDDRGWQAVSARLFDAKTYVNGDYVFETLVYDESAQIARPPERRSDAWITRARGQAYFYSLLQPVSQSHSVEVTPMGGHWFWLEQIFHYPRAPTVTARN